MGCAMVACVHIPVQNSEEEVEVALDQLPRDASDILDILKAEQAPLDIWLIIAVRTLPPTPRFCLLAIAVACLARCFSVPSNACLSVYLLSLGVRNCGNR